MKTLLIILVVLKGTLAIPDDKTKCSTPAVCFGRGYARSTFVDVYPRTDCSSGFESIVDEDGRFQSSSKFNISIVEYLKDLGNFVSDSCPREYSFAEVLVPVHSLAEVEDCHTLVICSESSSMNPNLYHTMLLPLCSNPKERERVVKMIEKLHGMSRAVISEGILGGPFRFICPTKKFKEIVKSSWKELSAIGFCYAPVVCCGDEEGKCYDRWMRYPEQAFISQGTLLREEVLPQNFSSMLETTLMASLDVIERACDVDAENAPTMDTEARNVEISTAAEPVEVDVVLDCDVYVTSFNGLFSKPVLRIRCLAGCQSKWFFYVYGTRIYSHFSFTCRAAIHDGRITDDGGVTYVKMFPKQTRYFGSAANGVESLSFSNEPMGPPNQPWEGGSIVFCDTADAC